MNAAQPVSGKSGLSLNSPLVVTGILVLIVMSLVIPLPAAALDFGIALSIATATLVLVMASLVNRPTDFQAFPILLLVSLVIRLSLNVSSTRLILTDGHTGTDAAGQVINGFADFVAGGSLLVGLTVFGVISVVNFMVITKGSGRMAEVAARFALDSLPGKQLAIDGDLSSGAITHEEAKQRRANEQREISFFGSLDGASKFVKGDAIAGIVITLINLLVGLAVGIGVHGMPAGQAVATYSHLTIGDGLVSQVPSLITSMAAALLLSRGGATEDTASLISTEFAKRWQASAVVAGAMVCMALVPGMPSLLFLGVATVMAAVSWKIYRRQGQEENLNAQKIRTEAAAKPVSTSIGDILDTDDICVEIGADLVPMALDPARGLGSRITNLRIHIARHFGLILPDVRIIDSDELPPGDYVIKVQGVIRGRGQLRAGQVLALGPGDVLADIPGLTVREPVYNSPAVWIDPAEQDDAATNGATVVTPMEVLSTHLMEVTKAQMPSLLTLGAMQRQIDELKQLSDPARAERNRRYFDSVIPEKVTPETLLAILRALLEERISIRNLPLILDALCEYRHIESIETLYELVRKRLRGQITQSHITDDGQLQVIQLHPAWETEFTRTEADAGHGQKLMLTPDQTGRLLGSVRKALAQSSGAPNAVIAAADHRRRTIRAVLASNGVTTPVIGLDEIDPSADLRLVATVEAA